MSVAVAMAVSVAVLMLVLVHLAIRHINHELNDHLFVDFKVLIILLVCKVHKHQQK